MKRIFCILLVSALLFVSGCSATRTDVTLEEVAAAYEAAGYEVSTHVYDEKLDNGAIAYVQATHPDGGYIYFSIFESEADAEAYKKESYHPAMMGLFSAIFGDPSWHRYEVHGCIVAEYDEPDFLEPFLEPFEELLKSN